MNTSARQIQLMDTTLRDGEQTQGVSFTPSEKVHIAKALLGSLNIDRIEVASARVSKGEKRAVADLNKWAQREGLVERIEVLGFVDFSKSVDWIKEAGGQVINLLTKGSEKHCREQLGKDLAGHVADIRRTVAYALDQKLKVNVYLEDWSNGYRDSPEYVFGLLDELRDIGISHFMLPDTLGIMSPEEVYASLGDMTSRYPDLLFDFHPHNDYGLAVANAMAAVRAGVSTIHCTVNCLGERAGNVSVAELAVVLRDKMNIDLSIDETSIVHLSNLVANFSGKKVASNAPIVGKDVFTQTAGIHADGDQKGDLYKTRLSPERFARSRSYALGKLSGKASLAKNLEALGLNLSEKKQAKVLKQIIKLGDSKQRISIDDLPFIIADVLESTDFHHIKLLDCSIASRLNQEAVVGIKVDINGRVHESVGSGNGGFDAFIDAVKKVLPEYHVILPELIDFEVQIPRGGNTNALTECIISWQDDKGKQFKTRGLHANQVYASVKAALRAINIVLHGAGKS